MAMERFTVSLNEKDIDLFERERADMGMNKSAYIRYLIAEHKNKVPPFLKYKELTKTISELNTSIKALLLLDNMEDSEKIYLFEQIKEINIMVKELLQ